jgi:hypothetical protein
MGPRFQNRRNHVQQETHQLRLRGTNNYSVCTPSLLFSLSLSLLLVLSVLPLTLPVLLSFLDPAFFVHNEAGERLLLEKWEVGVHPLPKDLDESTMRRWKDHHKPAPGTLENVLADIYL